ncbi:unnamed protein product, partial [Prorocentrum cordatum]
GPAPPAQPPLAQAPTCRLQRRSPRSFPWAWRRRVWRTPPRPRPRRCCSRSWRQPRGPPTARQLLARGRRPPRRLRQACRGRPRRPRRWLPRQRPAGPQRRARARRASWRSSCAARG